MKSIIYLLLICSSCFLFSACDDDDNLFSGSDNYITVFELNQENNTYIAQITKEGNILLTIPENVPLDGMKPKVTISENATIIPLPETITDWSQDLIFRVKSYSGTEREYRYSLIRTEIPEHGTVHLHTQAEVDAFAESGIKTVEGSLFIGTTHEVAPSDSIVSLEALASLEKVGGNVTVYPTYKASEFNIRNLKSIGGNFNVTLNNVHTLRMPSLETVYGTLTYSSEGTEMLTVHVAHTVDLPSLKVIGDNLEINIANYYSTITEDSHISLPELEKIGGKLTAGINIVSAYVKFPKLKEVGSIEWKGSMGAETDKAIYGISFDALERVNGDFIMKDVAGLCELAAPDLVSVDGKLDISIQNGMHLKVTDFRSLVSINSDLKLGSLDIEDMTGFSSLEHIGGNFSCTDGRNNRLTSLKGLENLKTIGGGEIYVAGPNLADVGGLKNIESLVTSMVLSVSKAEVSNIESLKNIRFESLYLYLSKGEQVYDIRGFQFEKLTLQSDPNGEKTLASRYMLDENIEANLILSGFITIDGLRTMTGELNCGKRDNSMSSIRYFDFTALEEVTGDLYYVRNAYDHNFPKLKKISGNLTAYMAPVSVGVNPFPVLEEIGGTADLQINVTELNFPQLKKVNGELKITKGLSWSNNPIQTMDGFSSLESAGRLNIQYCSELYSYQGLEKAIKNLKEKSQWEVSHNKYNPSYEDVKAGKLVMP